MSKKNPRHLDQSIRAKLLNLSKQKKVDFNNLVTRYISDRFLYRLSQSKYQEKFVLKGATLFKCWQGELHRPTKDLDFLAYGNNEISELIQQLKAVCEIQCEDGVQFHPESIKGEKIKEDQEYEGVRIHINYKLASVQGKIQIDIGFGDIITPQASEVKIPTFLDLPAPHLRIYPRETVVAEKFQAMVYLGISNSRMKDFYDLLFLAKNFEFKGQILKEAIEATFKRRKTSISEEIPLALTEEFTQNLAKEKAWKGFLNKNQLEPENPTLRDIIEELKLFLIPPYIAISKNQVFEKTWRPDQKWL